MEGNLYGMSTAMKNILTIFFRQALGGEEGIPVGRASFSPLILLAILVGRASFFLFLSAGAEWGGGPVVG